MRHGRWWIVVLGVMVLPPAGPGRAQGLSAPPDPLAVTNARVLDVRTGQVEDGLTLLLRDGKIAAIGRDPAPPGITVLDIHGLSVVPGLIDAHAHMATLAGARRALESGVTTARSASTPMFADRALGELARRGVIAGPDIIPAGIHVGPRLGEDLLADPGLADLAGGVKTIEDIRRVVRINLEHGARVIKTSATERAGTPDTDPRQIVFREPELRAIVEEAGSRNVPVEVHAHGDEGAMMAVRAGVRSIEHGTYLSDATLRLMKERGTFFVPTYSTVIDIAEPGGDYDESALRLRGQHMLAHLKGVVQRAHAMGVKIATGADTEYGPRSLTRVSHEVANFVEMGMTPIAAIQSATIAGAELLGLHDRTGELKQGFDADLLIVDGDPLKEIELLQDPMIVISNGRVALNRLTALAPGQSSGAR